MALTYCQRNLSFQQMGIIAKNDNELKYWEQIIMGFSASTDISAAQLLHIRPGNITEQKAERQNLTDRLTKTKNWRHLINVERKKSFPIGYSIPPVLLNQRSRLFLYIYNYIFIHFICTYTYLYVSRAIKEKEVIDLSRRKEGQWNYWRKEQERRKEMIGLYFNSSFN